MVNQNHSMLLTTLSKFAGTDRCLRFPVIIWCMYEKPQILKVGRVLQPVMESAQQKLPTCLNTKYIVSVCACAGREIRSIGNESDEITTKNLAFKIKSSSTLLHLTPVMPNSLPTYAVKFDEERNDIMNIRRIIIGMVSRLFMF